jgi:hypothetical protein
VGNVVAGDILLRYGMVPLRYRGLDSAAAAAADAALLAADAAADAHLPTAAADGDNGEAMAAEEGPKDGSGAGWGPEEMEVVLLGTAASVPGECARGRVRSSVVVRARVDWPLALMSDTSRARRGSGRCARESSATRHARARRPHQCTPGQCTRQPPPPPPRRFDARRIVCQSRADRSTAGDAYGEPPRKRGMAGGAAVEWQRPHAAAALCLCSCLHSAHTLCALSHLCALQSAQTARLETARLEMARPLPLHSVHRWDAGRVDALRRDACTGGTRMRACCRGERSMQEKGV